MHSGSLIKREVTHDVAQHLIFPDAECVWVNRGDCTVVWVCGRVCIFMYMFFFLEGECFYKWITLREIEI